MQGNNAFLSSNDLYGGFEDMKETLVNIKQNVSFNKSNGSDCYNLEKLKKYSSSSLINITYNGKKSSNSSNNATCNYNCTDCKGYFFNSEFTQQESAYLKSIQSLGDLTDKNMNSSTDDQQNSKDLKPHHKASTTTLIKKEIKSLKYNLNNSEDKSIKHLYQINKTHVAEQLCFLDSEMFQKIDWPEFSSLGWISEKKKEELSPNIMKMISQSNKIGNQVIVDIVNTNKLNNRVKALSYYVELAFKLWEFGNLNSSKIIVATLQDQTIYRLSKTWNGLNSKRKKIYYLLESFYDPCRNSIAYPAYIDERIRNNAPLIPFLGIFLSRVVYATSMKKINKEPLRQDVSSKYSDQCISTNIESMSPSPSPSPVLPVPPDKSNEIINLKEFLKIYATEINNDNTNYKHFSNMRTKPPRPISSFDGNRKISNVSLNIVDTGSEVDEHTEPINKMCSYFDLKMNKIDIFENGFEQPYLSKHEESSSRSRIFRRTSKKDKKPKKEKKDKSMSLKKISQSILKSREESTDQIGSVKKKDFSFKVAFRKMENNSEIKENSSFVPLNESTIYDSMINKSKYASKNTNSHGTKRIDHLEDLKNEFQMYKLSTERYLICKCHEINKYLRDIKVIDQKELYNLSLLTER